MRQQRLRCAPSRLMYSQPMAFMPFAAMASATEMISASLQMSCAGSGCGSNGCAQSPSAPGAASERSRASAEGCSGSHRCTTCSTPAAGPWRRHYRTPGPTSAAAPAAADAGAACPSSSSPPSLGAETSSPPRRGRLCAAAARVCGRVQVKPGYRSKQASGGCFVAAV